MKQLKFFLLLATTFCFSITYAQQKILIVPYPSDEIDLCNLEKDVIQRGAIEEMGKEFQANGYTVVNTVSELRKLKAQNKCNGSNIDKIKALAAASQADLYLSAEILYQTTANGNQVTLNLIAYNATTHEELTEQNSKSNKMMSDDVALLSKQALKKSFSSLKASIEGAGIATKTQEIGKKAAPATTKIELTSDADINIPQGKVNPNAVAVVIGNRDYVNPDVPSVDFAIHDARSMRNYLVQALGFKEGNIIMVENATQAKFNGIFGTEGNHEAQLYNFVKANESDVFVFYSGHGAPNPETSEGYFVPVDTDPSLIKYNGYSVKTLYANLSKIPYKSLTVVIDACFSGSSDKGMLLKNISPVFIKTDTKVLNDEKAMIFSSASSEQVSSWYPEKRHSLFTYFFLKALQGDADKNKDKKVTLGEMKAFLGENVTYMARRLNNREQTPQINGNLEAVVIEK